LEHARNKIRQISVACPTDELFSNTVAERHFS
jgi:hypothetical protein